MVDWTDAERAAISSLWGNIDVGEIGPQALVRYLSFLFLLFLIWFSWSLGELCRLCVLIIYIISGFWLCTRGLRDTSMHLATCPATPPSPETLEWLSTERQWWVDWIVLWRTWTTSRIPMPSWAWCTPRSFMWILITSGYVATSDAL